MALEIIQKPLYSTFNGMPQPVGQQVIFAVRDNTIVATKFNVKFIAEVYVGNQNISLTSTNQRIGSFKTTPNNRGVGIFDLNPILESFVKSDNIGSTFGNGSRYKNNEVTHPIHLIDKYAVSENAVRYYAINFYVQYENSAGVMFTSDPEPSNMYTFFNGVLQPDDILTVGQSDYGYNMSSPTNFFISTGGGHFLSNAPTTQYARLSDYGTLPFFNFLPQSTLDRLDKIILTYYWDGGSSSQNLSQNWTNGGLTNNTVSVYKKIMYYGGFPANLQNWSTTADYGGNSFETAIGNGLTHYTIQGSTTKGAATYLSELYTIQIICPNGQGFNKGYEMIRLAWLNKWGFWDYYTFTMKSTRSISTKRIPYQQQGGTWNESRFKIQGYKGGKKNFKVNSTVKIKINTDFVTEAEGKWFEELINSPEVYIINKYDGNESSPYASITNKYVEPVTLTTSNYIRKTVANDKLMQYTFEIEKSKMLRTQAV